MSTRKETIQVRDRSGFHYEVLLKHYPHFGFSTALYEDRLIAQVELGRILEPGGDNEQEWEWYEDRFAEWTDDIKTNIIPQCESHFNQKKVNL